MDTPHIDPLHEMKSQLTLLRQKLDEQKLVNDRLLRKTVNTKVHSLNRDALIIGIVGLVGVPYTIWSFDFIGISWPYAIVTAAFLLLAVGYTRYSHRELGAELLARCTLAEVGRRIARMKMLYARWLRFSIPFLFVWFCWFLYEIWGLPLPEGEKWSMICGGTIGGLIGGGIGIFSYRRTQRIASEILNQISDSETESEPE